MIVPRVSATAVLTRGKITQRVGRIGPPTKEAVRFVEGAARIANLRRRGARMDRQTRPGSRPFRIIGVSMYSDVLKRIDRAVLELKDAGLGRMSRSELIRIAFDRLDVSKLVGGST